jgi:hypothetical protein
MSWNPMIMRNGLHMSALGDTAVCLLNYKLLVSFKILCLSGQMFDYNDY